MNRGNVESTKYVVKLPLCSGMVNIPCSIYSRARLTFCLPFKTNVHENTTLLPTFLPVCKLYQGG